MSENIRRSKFVEGLIDFVGGSVGGVATVYVGQPLDTVKVKMQTFPKIYNGMLDCFIKTYRSEGFIRGLYAGTGPAIMANVAENSVLFACYGVCQKFIATVTNTPDVTQLGAVSNAAAGSLASFFSAFSLCPTELIKVKLQCAREVGTVSGNKIEVTATKLIREIVQRNGFFGLFQGLQSTIVREMPGYFVFFGAYEGCRELLKPVGKTKEDCGTFATIVSGAASGIALWSVIYPIDVVKSRIQVSRSTRDMNLFMHILDISRKEGFLVLYSGLQPTLIRTIPASAALFLTYEWTKKILGEIMLY